MSEQTTEKPRGSDNLNSLVSSVFEKLSPYSNIVGINDEGFVFEGYDGKLEAANNRQEWEDPDNEKWFKDQQLTKEERTALADEMIKRWTDYKTSIC